MITFFCNECEREIPAGDVVLELCIAPGGEVIVECPSCEAVFTILFSLKGAE